jgi:biotin carboxyl carrier protein
VEDGWKDRPTHKEAEAVRFELLFDGKVFDIDMTHGKIIRIQVDEDNYEAKVIETGNGPEIRLEGTNYMVEFKGSEIFIDGLLEEVKVRNLRRASRSTDQSTGPGIDKIPKKAIGGEGIIHPPMPGRIISLKVKEGDNVKAGSPVLLLEAMKMQNEVVSNMDGTVREIRVSEGDQVETEDVLMVIS